MGPRISTILARGQTIHEVMLGPSCCAQARSKSPFFFNKRAKDKLKTTKQIKQHTAMNYHAHTPKTLILHCLLFEVLTMKVLFIFACFLSLITMNLRHSILSMEEGANLHSNQDNIPPVFSVDILTVASTNRLELLEFQEKSFTKHIAVR